MGKARPFVYAAVILLFLSLALNFYLYFSLGKGGVIQGNSIFNPGKNSLDNKALLGTYPPDWGENSSGFIFSYHIINYGNAEAKGVTVDCNIYNSSNGSRITHSYEDYAGDLPPRSDGYRESVFPVYQEYNRSQNLAAACVVSGCSNDCEILYKRVPSLVKVFG